MNDNKKKRKRAVSEKSHATRAPLNDLEPPRIYRDAQQSGKPPQRQRQAPTKNQTRRRQNKKRRLKNSVRRGLLGFCLLMVLLIFGSVLSLTVFFKAENITAQGSGIYTSEEIIEASGVSSEDNLFLLDEEDIESRITRALPYVGEVTIERELPNTVNIVVIDTTASYSIQNEDGTYILLDINFKVLEKSAVEQPDNTIIISSADVSSANPGNTIAFSETAVQERLTTLAQAVYSCGMAQATEIYTLGVNSNYVVYMGRIVFELGSLDDLEDKIIRGLASCEKLDESSSNISGTLNLTVDKQSYFTAG